MAKLKTDKPCKKSFVDGVTDRYRETKSLGQTLVNEPRAFPGEILRILRRSARKLWNARGGGFYACGFVISFFILEVRMFIDDVVNFSGFESLSQEVIQYLLRFFLETLGNTLRAFMWPVYVIELSPLFGSMFLGLGFWLFPLYLKKPVEDWLFQDAEDESAAGKRPQDPDESN